MVLLQQGATSLPESVNSANESEQMVYDISSAISRHPPSMSRSQSSRDSKKTQRGGGKVTSSGHNSRSSGKLIFRKISTTTTKDEDQGEEKTRTPLPKTKFNDADLEKIRLASRELDNISVSSIIARIHKKVRKLEKYQKKSRNSNGQISRKMKLNVKITDMTAQCVVSLCTD